MYSSILVAVDLDQPDSWAKSLPTAVALARCFAARLSLCSVVRDEKATLAAQWSAIAYREMLDVARAKLATLADTVADLDVGTEVATGTVRGGILEAAVRVEADLIVLSSHRPEMKDYLLGANASRVVRSADCSVLVVRGALPAQQAK